MVEATWGPVREPGKVGQAIVACSLVALLAISGAAAAAALPQDDAGTGEDAPDEPSGEVQLGSGETVRGTILVEGPTSIVEHTHDVDHYSFEADAGQHAEARIVGQEACVRIVDEAGDPVDGQPFWDGSPICSAPGIQATGYDDATLPEDGTYYLAVLSARHAMQTPYSLTLGVDERASLHDPVVGLTP